MVLIAYLNNLVVARKPYLTQTLRLTLKEANEAFKRDSINGGNGGHGENGRISIGDVYSYTHLIIIAI